MDPGFNEAAGIHRRKRGGFFGRWSRLRNRFNEAAGIHRRKPAPRHYTQIAAAADAASMRPPEFTGGNIVTLVKTGGFAAYIIASMRPPEFTGGNAAAVKKNVRAWIVLQ